MNYARSNSRDRRIGGLAACYRVGGDASAQWKPTKTVDVIVHTGPGGGSDLLARAIATMMEKEKLLPVRMQVLNRPGGNGAVAAAAIAERKDDPHTIGLVTSVWIAGPLTSSEAKVTLQDLKPVAGLMLDPAVFAVRADSPYKTLARIHRGGESAARPTETVRRFDHLA